MKKNNFAQKIKEIITKHGFDQVGICKAEIPSFYQEKLKEALEKKHLGDLAWMYDNYEKRISPEKIWPEVKSIISIGMNYKQNIDPLRHLENAEKAVISVYALNQDYHDIIKKKLRLCLAELQKEFAMNGKFFVDTAPIMEKIIAMQAGIGWVGKHTNLVSKIRGSWLFLAEIFTDMELAYDIAETNHCGSCRKCIDICPTNAIVKPYELDARKCISYYTIECKTPFPEYLRIKMGNRVYGCDDCLAICPWNKFAQKANEDKFYAREELINIDLDELFHFDDASFRVFFQKSPIKRIKYDRFIRNIAYAMGNNPKQDLEILEKRQNDENPLIRSAVIWAKSMHINDHHALLHEIKNDCHPFIEIEKEILQKKIAS